MSWTLMEVEEGENGHLKLRVQHVQRKGVVNNLDVWRVTEVLSAWSWAS